MTNSDNFEQNILKHAILDREEFLDMYNPWQTEQGKEVIRNYTNIIHEQSTDNDVNKENFSWLTVEDDFKKEFLTGNRDKKVGIPANVDFALPNHVKGDIDYSNLFICLTNPNIQVEDKYLAESQYKNKNLNNLLPSLLDHIDIFNDEADVSSKIENFTTEEEVYKHIINFDENILETEFKLLISNRGSSRIKEQLKNKTTFYKNYYYLGKYFYPILGKSSRETVFKKMKNKFLEKKSYEEDKLFVEKIEEASICNLESFPFRSTVPNLGNDGFGRKLLNNKNKTVLLSARIILRRIALYLNSETSEKPIFIFRRFNDAWRNSIENVLTEDYKVENEEINDFVNYLEKNYFYTFGRRDVNNLSSALITKEGIQKQDEKIDSSQLDEIKHKANINLFI